MNLTPLTVRRLQNFKSNKRGYYSTITFLILFFISVFAELIANDKPIFILFNGESFNPKKKKNFKKN